MLPLVGFASQLPDGGVYHRGFYKILIFFYKVSRVVLLPTLIHGDFNEWYRRKFPLSKYRIKYYNIYDNRANFSTIFLIIKPTECTNFSNLFLE